jgi:dihydroorotate dehydrogenase
MSETQSCIVLAAGMIKTAGDVGRALELPIGEVTIGSITLEEKIGNHGTTFWADGYGNFYNAIGLKNGGAPYYRAHLPEMTRLIREAGRTMIVSVSGTCMEENASLAQLITHTTGGYAVIELNLACPNVVVGTGDRKPLIGYSSDSTIRGHIQAVGINNVPRTQCVRIKVPPYTDLELLKSVAGIIREMHRIVNITHVVATNTLPGCLPLGNDGREMIEVGLAGGSGEQLHALAVGNVREWRKHLPPEIGVIGVGGVREARHVRAFERVGASHCQMAGAFWEHGPKALTDVLMGL